MFNYDHNEFSLEEYLKSIEGTAVDLDDFDYLDEEDINDTGETDIDVP